MSNFTVAEITDRIISARVNMLLNQPFFGNLALRLIPIDATKWMPTCATDNKYFYYNRNFVGSLSRQELTFVFSHEVMHCAWETGERRGSRHAATWNDASDYAINLEISDARVGTPPKTYDHEGKKVFNCLLDKKYDGMATDQIYDLLIAERKKNGTLGNGSSNFDWHVTDLEDLETDPTGENGPIPMSADEREKLRDETRQAVMQAAKAAGAGNVPGSIRRMITDLTEPQMDWRELLTAHIQSAFKDDYSWSKPSRRSAGSIFIMPGLKNAVRVEIDIAIDVSGSITNAMLKDMLGEVYGIMTQFDDFLLRIWSFDTTVYPETVMVLTPDTIEDIHNYNMRGGGGTDFECNWEYMKREDITPHRFVMFTDGYPCGSWGDDVYCDTLFIIHGNKNIVAPFGQTAYYDFD